MTKHLLNFAVLPQREMPAKPLRVRVPPPGKKWLRGPIPLDWIGAAAKAPYRALQMGIALWFVAGLEGTSRVRVPSKLLTSWGVSQSSRSRSIKSLEDAGLISVERVSGRLPVVTILSAPKSMDEGHGS